MKEIKCIQCGAGFDPSTSVGALNCTFHPGSLINAHYTCCGVSIDGCCRHTHPKYFRGCMPIDHMQTKEERQHVMKHLYHPIMELNAHTSRLEEPFLFRVSTTDLKRTKKKVPGLEEGTHISLDLTQYHAYIQDRLRKESRNEGIPYRGIVPSLDPASRYLRDSFAVLYSTKLKRGGNNDAFSLESTESGRDMVQNNVSIPLLMQRIEERQHSREKPWGYWDTSDFDSVEEQQARKRLALMQEESDNDDDDGGTANDDVDPLRRNDLSNNEHDTRYYITDCDSESQPAQRVIAKALNAWKTPVHEMEVSYFLVRRVGLAIDVGVWQLKQLPRCS